MVYLHESKLAMCESPAYVNVHLYVKVEFPPLLLKYEMAEKKKILLSFPGT